MLITAATPIGWAAKNWEGGKFMDIEVYAYEIELNENKSRVIHGYLQSKHHFFLFGDEQFPPN